MVVEYISQALVNLADPFVLLLMVGGIFLGILMGSIPGMTATMTIAVLLSFTFTMEPSQGMILLLGIYGGLRTVYAGSIPAILIRTPGTPSAAATIFDGHPLSQKGEAGRAIRVSTIASFVGGVISVLALMFFSPVIADAALRFRSPEFFALAFFGLTIIASVSGDSLTKGMVSGLLGMLVATVGIDPVTGFHRFTFDIPELLTGVEFIAVMIGRLRHRRGASQVLPGHQQRERPRRPGDLRRVPLVFRPAVHRAGQRRVGGPRVVHRRDSRRGRRHRRVHHVQRGHPLAQRQRPVVR